MKKPGKNIRSGHVGYRRPTQTCRKKVRATHGLHNNRNEKKQNTLSQSIEKEVKRVLRAQGLNNGAVDISGDDVGKRSHSLPKKDDEGCWVVIE